MFTTEKQDQDFQYKCKGCSSLRNRNMEEHSDHHKENTDICQQLSKINPWCLWPEMISNEQSWELCQMPVEQEI